MDFTALQLVPIHKHPKYMQQCCQLLNDEWPRGETARLRSIQYSRDSLPTSLILLAPDGQLLGHCKLKLIPNTPESCFLECVVIKRELRGKKLGTFLMIKTEEYCKNVLKFKMIYLSTKGQENFYAKLGFKLCAPVTIYGGFPAILKENHIEKESVPTITNNYLPQSTNNIPPPPSMPANACSVYSIQENKKSYMCKYL